MPWELVLVTVAAAFSGRLFRALVVGLAELTHRSRREAERVVETSGLSLVLQRKESSDDESEYAHALARR